MKARIEAQQASPDRHKWDMRRDLPRKPFETFKFLGLTSGMQVMDVGAGAGYTTEMLAAAVGPDGKVYSHNRERVYLRFADGYYKRTLDERLGNNRLPNVILHISEFDDFKLNEEIDLVYWGNNFHDSFYKKDNEVGALQVLRSIKKTLKPGGVLGITDHVGIRGKDNAELHRIEPDIVRAALKEAGFVIEAESQLFANANDNYDLPSHHEEVYLSTDRFFIRARKP